MLQLNIDTIHENFIHRIKDREKALVFHTLWISGGCSRKTLAQELGLRPITVSVIVRELLEDLLVIEEKKTPRGKRGGQERYLYVNTLLYTAAVIGVTSRKLYGDLVDMSGKVLKTESVFMPETSGNEALVEAIYRILKTLTDSNPGESTLIGISLSLPGTVQKDKKIWTASSRWPNLNKINLERLKSDFLVPVTIHRFLDPDLEFLLSTGRGGKTGNAILFHWGYGIGSAASVNGNVLTSRPGRFGEIGHWKTAPESTVKCRCGLKGCLETEAALWAILPKIEEKFPGAPEDEIEFSEFFLQNKLENLPVIKRALEVTTTSLANLCKIFYPDKIFLLGPFFESGPLLESLETLFFKEITEYGKNKQLFEVINNSGGPVEGSVYSLFREALRPLMKTRGNV